MKQPSKKFKRLCACGVFGLLFSCLFECKKEESHDWFENAIQTFVSLLGIQAPLKIPCPLDVNSVTCLNYFIYSIQSIWYVFLIADHVSYSSYRHHHQMIKMSVRSLKWEIQSGKSFETTKRYQTFPHPTLTKEKIRHAPASVCHKQFTWGLPFQIQNAWKMKENSPSYHPNWILMLLL